MARKPTSTSTRASANLSVDQMRSAITRLESRIAELRALDVTSLTDGEDPAVTNLSARIESTLSQIYGPDTHEFNRLIVAKHLDATGYAIAFAGYSDGGTPVSDIREGVDRGRKRAIALLEAEVTSLQEAVEHSAPQPAAVAVVGRDAHMLTTARVASPQPDGTSIFVVHGQDEPAKTEVARLIERAGLRAIILHEQANAGKTIIEKFEEHGAAAGYAVVVMTPDDMGGPVGGSQRPRARQNVIGELFWFAGKLGRTRVCALRKGDVEIPSDFSGIVYITMDDHDGWKAALLRELQKAGYTVDWGKALA